MLWCMRDRVHRSHSTAENAGNVRHDRLPYFGVHVHEGMESFAGDDGDPDIVHRGYRSGSWLVVYQSHLADDASGAELCDRLAVNRLNSSRSFQDNEQIGTLVVLADDDVAASVVSSDGEGGDSCDDV